MKNNVVQLPFSGKFESAMPVRRKNADYRTREYLTLDEVKTLREAARKVGRHSDRDYSMILLASRHRTGQSKVGASELHGSGTTRQSR